MISINRYICVAAASVYGGDAMLTPKTVAGREQVSPIEDSDSPHMQPTKQWFKKHKSEAPTAHEIGTTSHYVYQWEQMTFGSPSRQSTKAFKGNGFALTDHERGAVGLVVLLALKLHDKQETNANEKLQAACNQVFELRPPTEWKSTHWKRFRQLITGKFLSSDPTYGRTWYKCHCRLTGEVVDHNKIDETTGVKLSPSIKAAVDVIFTAAFAGKITIEEVFNVMKNNETERPAIDRMVPILTELIKFDTLCESAISRQLLQFVLEAKTNGSQLQDFEALQLKLIKTPIYHFFVGQERFNGIPPPQSDHIEFEIAHWPRRILVTPAQAGMDHQSVQDAANKGMTDQKIGAWKKHLFKQFFTKMVGLLNRGYIVYRFETSTPQRSTAGSQNISVSFHRERNGAVRFKSKAAWFSVGDNGSDNGSFVQMSESSLVQRADFLPNLTKRQWWAVGFATTVYITVLIVAFIFCPPLGIAMVALAAVFGLIIAKVTEDEKESLTTDMAALQTDKDALQLQNQRLLYEMRQIQAHLQARGDVIQRAPSPQDGDQFAPRKDTLIGITSGSTVWRAEYNKLVGQITSQGYTVTRSRSNGGTDGAGPVTTLTFNESDDSSD